MNLEDRTPSMLTEAESSRTGAVALLRDLIRIPSLSSDEQVVVERLRQEMTSLGFDEVLTDPFGSVIGRIGSGRKVIVYDSHIDTVNVGSRSEWRTDPFDPVLEGGLAGGTVHGRGASDNKAGIAAMVHGAALYQRIASTDDVTLYVIGTVQEEDCDGLALEYALTHALPRPDVVVLGEATNGGVYRGNRGRVEVRLRIEGTSCHAAAPNLGRNPVYDMSTVIADLQSLQGRLAEDPFLGRGTVALTKIECETPSLNAVPSTATIYLDRRLTLGESPEAALAQLKSLPSVRASGGSVELLSYERMSFTGLRLTMPKQFETWVTPGDHVSVRAGVAAAERALGRSAPIGHWVFSTNGVASMGRLGIPTIGYGPGDEVHAHSAHDQCPTDDMVTSMGWYAAFPRIFSEMATADEVGAPGEEG